MSYVILLISSDYIILIVVTGLSFLFTVIIIVYLRRSLFDILQRKQAGDMLTEIVTTLNESIDEKETRIIDLMMRVDLLELRLQKQVEQEIKSGSNVRPITNINRSDITNSLSDINLSETEEVIIKSLSNGPMLVSEIRTQISKSREHTSRLISRLSKLNIIRKRNINGQVSCELTNQGKDILTGL